MTRAEGMGWAVVRHDAHGDHMHVATVSPSRRDAIINWLAVEKNIFTITNSTTDKEVERLWADHNGGTSFVVEVKIEAIESHEQN